MSVGREYSRSSANVSFEKPGILTSLGRMPWGFVALIVGMALFGTAMLFSSVETNPNEADLPYKHINRFVISFFVMIVLALTPLKTWSRISVPAYLGALFLLMLVPFIGETGGGAERWLRVGPVRIQPSEIMKLASILMLARYYQMVSSEDRGSVLRHLPAFAILMVPAFLIATQPDLGTTLMLIASGGVIIFLAGLSKYVVVSGLTSMPIGAVLGYMFVLKPYQRERVDTFISQLAGGGMSGSTGEAYQIEQAKIAIGSGGWTGKGYGEGIQSRLDYIPEQHTDFIFTVIAEEFGFLGAAGVLIVWGILLGWGLMIAMRCESRFGQFAAAGAVATIAFYVAFNIGMVNGLLPVVGVPLPLISFGGTAMLTTMACFGLILSAHIHRTEKMPNTGLFSL